GLSGGLDLDVTATAPTHEGNSVLRGAPAAEPLPTGA
ncbi:TatD family hydrolase, partial [Streptomyces sp. EKS3.2]